MAHGVFYYPKIAQKRVNESEFYALWFDAVEIKANFYRPPSPAMVHAWVKKTPQNFNFAVNARQKFAYRIKLGEEASGWKKPSQGFDEHDVELFEIGIVPLADKGKSGPYFSSTRCAFIIFPSINVERLEASRL